MTVMKLPRMARHENNTGQLKMRYLRKIRIAILITMEFRTHALVLPAKLLDSQSHALSSTLSRFKLKCVQ